MTSKVDTQIWSEKNPTTRKYFRALSIRLSSGMSGISISLGRGIIDTIDNIYDFSSLGSISNEVLQ